MTVERKPENQALPCFILKTAVFPLPLLYGKGEKNWQPDRDHP
jgi:hypothetical protein